MITQNSWKISLLAAGSEYMSEEIKDLIKFPVVWSKEALIGYQTDNDGDKGVFALHKGNHSYKELYFIGKWIADAINEKAERER